MEARLIKKALFVLLCLLAPCWGQQADKPNRVHESTVKVTAEQGRFTDIGSGVIVGCTPDEQRWIIVTAAHCCGDGAVLSVAPHGQTARRANVIYRNSISDIAVVETTRTAKDTIEPTPLAVNKVQPGQWCHIEGYPRNVYSSGWAQVKDTNAYWRDTVKGTEIITPLLTFDRGFVSGISGGPIRNQQGELVSVVSVSDEKSVGHSVTQQVMWDALIKSGVAKQVERTSGEIVPVQCSGGRCYPTPQQYGRAIGPGAYAPLFPRLHAPYNPRCPGGTCPPAVVVKPVPVVPVRPAPPLPTVPPAPLPTRPPVFPGPSNPGTPPVIDEPVVGTPPVIDCPTCPTVGDLEKKLKPLTIQVRDKNNNVIQEVQQPASGGKIIMRAFSTADLTNIGGK